MESGVSGLTATPGRRPAARIWSISRNARPLMTSACGLKYETIPRSLRGLTALAKGSRYCPGSVTIRWMSSGSAHTGAMAAARSGERVMLGTKCPSMTSKWYRSARVLRISS